VLRFPSAVLAVGLCSIGTLLLVAGLIIHTITRRFQELDYKLQLLHESILEQANKPVWPSQRQAAGKAQRSEHQEMSAHG
jgi:hypothetical protein